MVRSQLPKSPVSCVSCDMRLSNHRGARLRDWSTGFKKGVAIRVLATKRRIYPLVTIARTEFHNAMSEELLLLFSLLYFLGGFGYNGGLKPDISQDGGNRGAGAAQGAGRSVGRGHRRHPQGVRGHARYVAQTPGLLEAFGGFFFFFLWWAKGWRETERWQWELWWRRWR